MTIEEIINKWMDERERLSLEMYFYKEHNLPHERKFLCERDKAIGDILFDLRYNLNKEE